MIGAVLHHLFVRQGVAVVVETEEVGGGADDGIFSEVGIADDVGDGEANILPILRRVEHLFIEGKGKISGAYVQVINSVHHQLGAGAFFSEDEVVAVFGLAEEGAGFSAENQDGDG